MGSFDLPTMTRQQRRLIDFDIHKFPFFVIPRAISASAYSSNPFSLFNIYSYVFIFPWQESATNEEKEKMSFQVLINVSSRFYLLKKKDGFFLVLITFLSHRRRGVFVSSLLINLFRCVLASL